MQKDIILASASPRRKELLHLCGVQFKIEAANINEELLPQEKPEHAIRRFSLEKANAIAKRFPEALVIGADTDVVLDGEVFGKPLSEDDAFQMLSKLQGRTHQVIGAFSLVCLAEARSLTHLTVTDVTFMPMSVKEIKQYIKTGEPFGKAGAYAIQGYAMQFIEKIHGSYPNVVGLDVAKLIHELEAFTLC